VAWSQIEEPCLQEEDNRRLFEQVFMPHMPAAYNLARWLLRDEHEAEDLVQEAYLRAWKSFAEFHGSDGRPWLLTIIRNSCYSRLRRKQVRGPEARFDEEVHIETANPENPESLLMQKEDRQSLHEAIESLPVEFREAIVLRELEGLTYKEIAAVADISMGTVMSRLSRGRAMLQRLLDKRLIEES
jgi:RNA polymerase sigma-70 factor, ECF subfamily